MVDHVIHIDPNTLTTAIGDTAEKLEQDNTPPDNVTTLQRPTADNIRARLAAQERVGGGRPPLVPQPEGDAQDLRTYEIAISDGQGGVLTLIETGFIVATSVFVGIADDAGLLQAVYPLDKLFYVRQSNADEQLEVEVDLDTTPGA